MPEARTVVAIDGWDYSGVKLLRKRGNDWDEALPFQVVPRAIVYDEDEQIRGFEVTVRWRNGTELPLVIPSRFLSATRPSDVLADKGLDLIPAEARTLAEFLSAIRAQARDMTSSVRVTRAEWRGDELWAPGRFPAADWLAELGLYGDRADVPEDVAREKWASVVKQVRRHPKWTVVLGFPLGALYVPQIRGQRLFTVHITGESRQGKSEAAAAAMQTLGDARYQVGRLYRNWNMSDKAPGNVLKEIGVMPTWFDEAANDERDPEKFTELLFNLMDGRERRVAATNGTNISGDVTWTACVLSTGEARLIVKSGLSGFRRRVMEVYAPLVLGEHGALLMEEVGLLAEQAHGWQLKWLVENPEPGWVADLAGQLFTQSYTVSRDQQVEEAQAQNVALCVAGFGKLARLVGVDIPRAELQERVNWMLEKLMRAGHDEGADIGERGLRAVVEAMAREPGSFPPAREDQQFGYRRWGVIFDDGVVGIMGKSTLEMILSDFGQLGDSQTVLDKWADMGVLVHDRGSHQGRRNVWMQGQGVVQKVLYLVRVGVRVPGEETA